MDKVEVTERHVVSHDGTRIGYLQRGSGPGVVLIQGAMGTAYNYDDLANSLASGTPSFTVYTPDRRGRGMSPKEYSPDHTITRDVEDIDTILAETGANRVFGLSSGAVITLEAARTLPRITHAAVYEPPFYRDGISQEGVAQLNAQIERGDLWSGLMTSLATTQMVPALSWLPRPMAWMLGGVALAVDDRKHGEYARVGDMLPGIRYVSSVPSSLESRSGSRRFAHTSSQVRLQHRQQHECIRQTGKPRLNRETCATA